jgi:tetratricopeptide (TPR) repeat protein
VGGQGISADLQIAGCTALIQAGREPTDNLAAAFSKRGTAYFNKGDHDRAIADYDQVIRLKPDDGYAYFNRGIAYDSKGDYDRAIADYDQATRLKPDFVDAYNNRGYAYSDKGDYDHAIADYDQAIRLKPDYEYAYNNRGFAHSLRGDYDRAIADYDQAIRLKPDDASANNGACWNRAILGRDLDRALSECNEALRLRPGPGEASTLDSRAFVYFRLGRYDEAIADATAALAKNPKLAGSLYVRGLARIASGDRPGGSADVDAANAIQPDVAGRYARYGVKEPG